MINTLVAKVNELRAYETEREWFEFKENWFDPKELGEYISAMSNSAAYEGQECAYFIWGVQDETHELIDTKFDPNCDVKGEPLKHFLARQLYPDIDFRFEEIYRRKKGGCTCYSSSKDCSDSLFGTAIY